MLAILLKCDGFPLLAPESNPRFTYTLRRFKF